MILYYFFLGIFVGYLLARVVYTIKSNRMHNNAGILTGEDAKRFNDNMKKAETEKIPDSVRDRIRKNYLALKSISKF